MLLLLLDAPFSILKLWIAFAICKQAGMTLSATSAVSSGFTHRLGDRVAISTPSLGTLVNHVNHSEAMPPWTFGVRALYRSLAARGLL